MKRHYLLFLALLPLIGWAHEDTLRLSLDDCIMMARRQSIDAAVALGELRSAYWQWRSYRADLLPEVSLSGTAPSWNKRYSSYQQADGSLSSAGRAISSCRCPWPSPSRSHSSA